MKKLNNRGWGLSTLLSFLAVFFIFIIAIIILYNSNKSNVDNDVITMSTIYNLK